MTVGCVEQGLLLFRIRNELRATLDSYRRAYGSGVEFGLRKAIKAELELERIVSQVSILDSKTQCEGTSYNGDLTVSSLSRCITTIY